MAGLRELLLEAALFSKEWRKARDENKVREAAKLKTDLELIFQDIKIKAAQQELGQAKKEAERETQEYEYKKNIQDQTLKTLGFQLPPRPQAQQVQPQQPRTAAQQIEQMTPSQLESDFQRQYFPEERVQGPMTQLDRSLRQQTPLRVAEPSRTPAIAQVAAGQVPQAAPTAQPQRDIQRPQLPATTTQTRRSFDAPTEQGTVPAAALRKPEPKPVPKPTVEKRKPTAQGPWTQIYTPEQIEALLPTHQEMMINKIISDTLGIKIPTKAEKELARQKLLKGNIDTLKAYQDLVKTSQGELPDPFILDGTRYRYRRNPETGVEELYIEAKGKEEPPELVTIGKDTYGWDRNKQGDWELKLLHKHEDEVRLYEHEGQWYRQDPNNSNKMIKMEGVDPTEKPGIEWSPTLKLNRDGNYFRSGIDLKTNQAIYEPLTIVGPDGVEKPVGGPVEIEEEDRASITEINSTKTSLNNNIFYRSFQTVRSQWGYMQTAWKKLQAENPKGFNIDLKVTRNKEGELTGVEEKLSVKAGEEVATRNPYVQAILVTFQKILDPNSVVRQSEYARSYEGEGQIEKIKGLFETILKGGSNVSTQVLEEYVELSKEFYFKATANMLDVTFPTMSLAHDYGISISYVLSPSVLKLYGLNTASSHEDVENLIQEVADNPDLFDELARKTLEPPSSKPTEQPPKEEQGDVSLYDRLGGQGEKKTTTNLKLGQKWDPDATVESSVQETVPGTPITTPEPTSKKTPLEVQSVKKIPTVPTTRRQPLSETELRSELQTAETELKRLKSQRFTGERSGYMLNMEKTQPLETRIQQIKAELQTLRDRQVRGEKHRYLAQ